MDQNAKIKALAELDRREAQVRKNTKPQYKAVARMCLDQIARERKAWEESK